MGNEFYTLGIFSHLADAHIIRAKLESEGVPTFVLEENRTYANPTQGTAISGIKLQVYTRDKDLAIAIYDEIRNYALDKEGKPVVCPNCKAQKSEVYYSRKGLINKLFPFFEKKKYRCTNCQMITKS